MTKQKTIIIIAIFLTILIGIVMIATRGTANAISPNSEKIAELNFQLSELQFKKLNCLDNLTRKESKAQMNGFAKYCVEYDEEIMGIETQIEELSERKTETETVEEERTPGKLNASGDAQEMPKVEGNDSHEKFKKLAESYGIDASMIRNVENHYGIKEGVILCITVAETSGGNRGAGRKNIGSVGSNDRGDRPTFALPETGLEAIGKTLTNRYLGSIQTLGCLSNAGSCQSRDDNGKRYATSNGNRERNMSNCLGVIYGKITPSTFTIRR